MRRKTDKVFLTYEEAYSNIDKELRSYIEAKEFSDSSISEYSRMILARKFLKFLYENGYMIAKAGEEKIDEDIIYGKRKSD